jgi:hypothetical protein
MGAAAGLQIDAFDLQQATRPCPMGGFTDLVRTSSVAPIAPHRRSSAG